MRKWSIGALAAVFLLAISGCNTATDNKSSINAEIMYQTAEETEPPIPSLESIEYWEIVQDEIVSMLNQHNLYISATTHGYPCVQFHVEPGIMTDDGRIVSAGLSQEEYEEVFESVKVELHIILDKYMLAKPKSAFHGCHSIVDIFFNNWVIDEKKAYDNVYSRDVACYGLDLLEYYYKHEENSYIQKDAFFADVWSKCPIFKQ